CFEAHALGSDLQDRVFLAGADDDEAREENGEQDSRNFVLIFDADSDRLGEIPLDADNSPATGVAADREGMYVTGPSGLSHYGIAEVVPRSSASVRCRVTTPLLFSPDRADRRRWLRIEA